MRMCVFYSFPLVIFHLTVIAFDIFHLFRKSLVLVTPWIFFSLGAGDPCFSFIAHPDFDIMLDRLSLTLHKSSKLYSGHAQGQKIAM